VLAGLERLGRHTDTRVEPSIRPSVESGYHPHRALAISANAVKTDTYKGSSNFRMSGRRSVAVGIHFRRTRQGVVHQVASYRLGESGMNDAQSQDLFERVEVAVAVEQGVAVDDAEGGDEAVDGLTDSEPACSQMAIVSG
jgi:hypothetical protein